jgi:SNF2 family DNA or RNA helicase
VARPQDFAPKTKPLPHQLDAISFITSHESAALFDEQGLGKTKIVIDAFAEMMRSKQVDAGLVVAPLTLLFNWEDEVAKHSHLVPSVIRGTRSRRKYQLLTGANFYIANYEALLGGMDIFGKLLKSRRMAIALDESSRIKDPRTQIAHALHSLGPLATHRVIMSGTPVANQPADLWSQFFFLDQGELLGKDYFAFSSRFREDSPGFRNELGSLSKQIAGHSIRRLKNDVLELPGKTFLSHRVQLCGSQQAAYTQCSEELLVELRTLSGEQYVRSIDSILEKLLRLIQIASNPALLDASYSGTNAKLALLDCLLPELLESHEKVILWSCFVSNVEGLAARFRMFGSRFIHGGTDLDTRAKTVRQFQNTNAPRVLVANPAAAREGLTLTRASAAIYYDRNFSLVDYLQSQDRIHRIGQERECEIHKIVASDTVDEYVDTIIELKQAVADYVYEPEPHGAAAILSLLRDKREIMRVLGGGTD